MKKAERDEFMRTNDAMRLRYVLPENATVTTSMDGTTKCFDSSGKGIIGDSWIISTIKTLDNSPVQLWVWPWSNNEPSRHILKDEMLVELVNSHPYAAQYVNMSVCKMTCSDHEVMLRALAKKAYNFEYITELSGHNMINVIGMKNIRPYRMEGLEFNHLKEVMKAYTTDLEKTKTGEGANEPINLPSGAVLCKLYQ